MAFNNVPINGWPQLKNLGAGEGTTDYSDLENKPQINSVTLSGNKSLADLGIAAASDLTALDSAVDDIEALIPASATASNKLATVADIPEDVYFDTTATLSTSATTTVTFTESEILATSVVDIAVSVWGIVPDDVVVSAGSCVITMPIVDTAVTVSIRLYVK